MDISSFSSDEFSLRHNSINKTDKQEMLKLIEQYSTKKKVVDERWKELKKLNF